MPRRRITEAMLDQAVELLEGGATVAAAAAQVGCTPGALYQRASRGDRRLRDALDNREPPQIESMLDRATDLLDRATDLLERGTTVAAAAQAVGCSKGTLYYWARRHRRLRDALANRERQTGQPKRLTEAIAAQLRDVWTQTDMTYGEICAQFQIAESTLKRWKDELGLGERPAEARRRAEHARKRAELTRLWADWHGLTVAELARHLEVSEGTIHRWKTELGLPLRRPGPAARPPEP